MVKDLANKCNGSYPNSGTTTLCKTMPKGRTVLSSPFPRIPNHGGHNWNVGNEVLKQWLVAKGCISFYGHMVSSLALRSSFLVGIFQIYFTMKNLTEIKFCSTEKGEGGGRLTFRSESRAESRWSSRRRQEVSFWRGHRRSRHSSSSSSGFATGIKRRGRRRGAQTSYGNGGGPDTKLRVAKPRSNLRPSPTANAQRGRQAAKLSTELNGSLAAPFSALTFFYFGFGSAAMKNTKSRGWGGKIWHDPLIGPMSNSS